MEPFLGQLALFPYGFVPQNWAACNGQLLPINQYQALFSLLGTTYGGNGTTTFALPNLQGRAPISQGGAFTLGQSGGEEMHTLTINEVPNHNHTLQGDAATANAKPQGNLLGQTSTNDYVQNPQTPTAMNPAMVAPAGGSLPHENRTPFLVLTWCIALFGIYPSRN